MKYILIIVLLYTHQFASADVSLTFKDVHRKDSKQTTGYQIKNDRLKLTESGSRRINIFNQKSQQFISFDPVSGKSSIFNEEILAQRVNQFNQRRLKEVTEVEKRLEIELKTMTPKEQEIGQSLINMLKYPDLYGKHTLLRVTAIPESDNSDHNTLSGKIPCKSYQLYRDKQLLKTFCMADAKSLNMAAQEYQTLRSYYAFDYTMQTQLMLAAGQSDFSLVDYEKENMPGVVIEIVSYKASDITQHLLLSSFDNDKLDDSVFIFKKAEKGRK